MCCTSRKHLWEFTCFLFRFIFLSETKSTNALLAAPFARQALERHRALALGVMASEEMVSMLEAQVKRNSERFERAAAGARGNKRMSFSDVLTEEDSGAKEAGTKKKTASDGSEAKVAKSKKAEKKGNKKDAKMINKLVTQDSYRTEKPKKKR